MLEQQQPQRHLSRRLRTTSGVAVLAPLSLCFVHAVDEFLIIQKLVRLNHPRFPKRLNVFGYDAFPQRLLRLLASRHASG